MSEIHNITENVFRVIEAALHAHAGTDRVHWDVSLSLVTTQQGPQPTIVALLQVPSPILGQSLNHMIFMDINDLEPTKLANSVTEALDLLRARRTELLNQPGQLSGGLAAQRAAALGQQNGQLN